jgi:hypothetical protein
MQTQDVKLIFLTMNEDPDLAMEAMRCRASAYLLEVSWLGIDRCDPQGAQGEKVSYATNRCGNR